MYLHPNQRSFIRPDNRRGAPGPGVNIGTSHSGVALDDHTTDLLTGIPAGPHMLRHAMAGAMLNQGAPRSLIQDIWGTACETTKKGTPVFTSALCARGRAVQPERYSAGRRDRGRAGKTAPSLIRTIHNPPNVSAAPLRRVVFVFDLAPATAAPQGPPQFGRVERVWCGRRCYMRALRDRFGETRAG